MSTNKLSRRNFLRLSVIAAAAGATVSQSTSTFAHSRGSAHRVPKQEATEIVIMYQANEIPEAEIEQFNADYAPLTLTRIDADPTRFFAMLAAGTPPHLLRTQAPDIPQYVGRGIPANLQSYFEASDVLSFDDLVDANNYYKANSATEVGEGDIYGMAKDWAPDGFLWVNELVFEAAGVTPPDPSVALSAEDIRDLAEQVSQKDGDRVLVTGLMFHDGFIDRYWMNMVEAAGSSLFSDDFTSARIADNNAVKDAIRFHFDMARADLMNSPRNPSVSWFGEDFRQGQLAMVQTGYWFSGQLRAFAADDEALAQAMADGKIKAHPGFTWAGERRNPCITAAGAIIVDSEFFNGDANTDAAWTAFEWFMGKEPAQNRAAGGWGLPALKSLYELTPQAEGFDAQSFDVVQNELDYAGDTLSFNPYVPGGEPMIMGSTYLENLEFALSGGFSFDDLLFFIEDETNFAISEGRDNL